MAIRDSKSMTEIAAVNDLRISEEVAGGFVFVHLYDADDYEQIQLGEDEILELHKVLGEVIERHKLR